MSLRLSCKEAVTLMVAREDRPLGLGERLGLRVHLAYCPTCPRFESQMLTLRRGLRQWRLQQVPHDEDGGSA